MVQDNRNSEIVMKKKDMRFYSELICFQINVIKDELVPEIGEDRRW
jgi:hypothetical protein